MLPLRNAGLTTAAVCALTAERMRAHVEFGFVELPVVRLPAAESALRSRWQPLLKPL